jgi:glutamate 5-kinase
MKSGELNAYRQRSEPGVLQSLMRGEVVGTLFLGGKNHMQSRKRWIALTLNQWARSR